MKTDKLYWKILDKKRLALLPKLEFLKKEGFYLAGGTALSLRIKHRISVDFDFYKQSEFNYEAILLEFQKRSKKTVLIQKATNTLIVKVDGVEISLFVYPYKLLKPLIGTKYIDLASIEDIAAMKLVAIIQRGIRRDFADLYFLIKYLGLAKIFDLTEKKYPPFNKYIGLQAITYFDDADIPLERKLILLEPVTWKEIKSLIISEAKKFKKTLKE
jgi:predicted nucleotidyltransferase component of viral defense system